jgi:prepilin-type N-terminal cleavage/methylation domain-containing protein
LKAKGFTLVELLVAVTITSIILFSLAQAIGFVSQLWLNGVGAVDNLTKARDIMAAMNRDVQMMVLRPDTAAFVDKNGNPAFAFYSNVQSSGADTRTVSLVEYTIPTGSQTLQRLTYGMNYSNAVTPMVSTPAPTVMSQLTTGSGGNMTPENMATGVLLFQYQFVNGSGTILTGASTSVNPTFTYDYINPRDPANPRAIIVSLLVLDNQGYLIASQNPAIMTSLLNLFNSALPAAGQTYGYSWNQVLNGGTFGPNLPTPIRSGVRVFQHYIPLPVISPGS